MKFVETKIGQTFLDIMDIESSDLKRSETIWSVIREELERCHMS